MVAARREGRPLWIADGTPAQPVSRIDLQPVGGTAAYDEAWLQRLIFDHPDVFPSDQIESRFGKLVPLCVELPLQLGGGRIGSLDVLLATAEGRLVLIETKLWRNPEARRVAVAQVMEYAAAVFAMGYEALQAAVRRAGGSERSLYDLASIELPDGDEAAFVDAVSQNLRSGRAIVALVGDGIREDIVPLAEMLQSHAGLRFTFALVEMAVYAGPQPGTRLIVPSVLARTALIERGVVRIEQGASGGQMITVTEPVATGAISAGPAKRSISLSEDEYFEKLGVIDATWPTLVKELLAKAAEHNVYADIQRTLSLKCNGSASPPLNLGSIDASGRLDTDRTTWWGRREPGRVYNEEIAALIGGKAVSYNDGASGGVRTWDLHLPTIPALLPKRADEWVAAMSRYIAAASGADGDSTDA